jgi:hypothetical protein
LDAGLVTLVVERPLEEVNSKIYSALNLDQQLPLGCHGWQGGNPHLIEPGSPAHPAQPASPAVFAAQGYR